MPSLLGRNDQDNRLACLEIASKVTSTAHGCIEAAKRMLAFVEGHETTPPPAEAKVERLVPRKADDVGAEPGAA